ncbi:hypothetical protein POSPLADRAFT_1145686, partial [Postia placenta MAD-698-R-SB12]
SSHRAFLSSSSMPPDLSTIEFDPTRGIYLALWLDPVKMAECVDNPRVRAAARKLSPRKYIAHVDANLDFPMPDRPWHRSVIRFVGMGMPEDQPDQQITSDMCVPIYPASRHPTGREPLRLSQSFPFANCYQYSHVSATVRISTELRDYRDAISLPVSEILRYYRLLDEDRSKQDTLRDQTGHV